jgi:signal transduction histidine kinase
MAGDTPTRASDTPARAGDIPARAGDMPACAGAGPRIAVVVGAAAVLVAATIAGQHAGGDLGAGLLALDVAVGILGCALLALLPRWPVAVVGALTVLVAVSPAATPLATIAVLQFARVRRFPAALAAAIAGVAAHAVQGVIRPTGGLSFAWWLVLLAAAYAALIGWGRLDQAHRALVASLRERAVRAEAEQGRRVAEARILERTRIAREMHDVLAHRLSLLATYAGALEYRPDASPEQLSRAAGIVRAGVHEALDELREVIGLLRDEDAAGDGDAAGHEGLRRPQPLLTDLPRLVDESSGAGVRIELRNRVADPERFPASTGRTAYRVVQEALTNARKHAAGQPVRVLLDGEPGSELRIEVRNPLPRDPFAPAVLPGAGTGLVGLTERVQLAGGRLDHEVTPAGEFRLHACLPWPA